MEIKRLPLGSMGTNCYLAWCPKTLEGVVIDPGFDGETVLKFIEELSLQVKYIINTHGHLDHIGANRELQTALHCPIAIGAEDAPMLTDAMGNLSYHMRQPVTSPAAELLLQDGDCLEFGACILQVLATPGHTSGGISLYAPGVLFAGDTLFNRSVGRSDLPGGNQIQLLDSIVNKLLTLPDETRVLPGHGPESTVGEERMYNPWLQG